MKKMSKTNITVSKNREELLADTANLSLKEIRDKDQKFKTLTDQLFKEGNKVQTSKLKVCFMLLQISDYKFWEGKYPTIYDYVENNFEMCKTTLNECLLVARRFGVYTEVTEIIGNNKPVVKYAPQYKLNPQYKDYGFKQLYIMRNFTDQQIETIGFKPEMSCREMQKAVEVYKSGLVSPKTDKKTETTEEPEKPAETEKPTEPKELGKVSVEELRKKPLKLPPSNGGYVVRLDELNNIVVTIA